MPPNSRAHETTNTSPLRILIFLLYKYIRTRTSAGIPRQHPGSLRKCTEMALSGPNVAIGLTVIILVALAGLLAWKGSSAVKLFGRKMFEAKRAQEVHLQRRAEQDSQA
ncbi:hypothetical protein DL764_010387 [Monosporascus ibericus]|uniref:Uncharacterized protein n=1 Tax=Monosporascus ibericus TaxID=155417 RepID=A0A4V1X8P8_9PEZI|nr:hypothetical protein DL764_010387 [Monosporascus ibericus]